MQTASTRESEAVNLCADRAHLQSNGHADPDLAEGINGPEDPTTADAGHPAATAEVLAFPPYEHNRDSFGGMSCQALDTNWDENRLSNSKDSASTKLYSRLGVESSRTFLRSRVRVVFGTQGRRDAALRDA